MYMYIRMHVYVVCTAHRRQQDMSQFRACSILMGTDLPTISLADHVSSYTPSGKRT